MMVHESQVITSVPGPDGKQITLKDLPEPTIRRWVTRRKAEVVAAVRGGLLTLKEACENIVSLSLQRLLKKRFSC